MPDLSNSTQDVELVSQSSGKIAAIITSGGQDRIASDAYISGGSITVNDTSATYSKIGFISSGHTLVKGVKNSIDIFPHTLGENMESTDDIVASLDGTNTDVGQVFRMTTGTTDITALALTLDISSTNDVVIDDFESYANEAALDAAWVQSDSTNTPATIETTIVNEGTQAMKIDITKNNSDSNIVTKSFTAEDWTASSGIRLRFRNDGANNNKIDLRISDGTNTSDIRLTSSGNAVWDTLILNFSDFNAVNASLADLSAITSISFFVDKDKITAPVYIDKIERLAADYGTVDIELYDFGTTANPTSLGTPLTFDNGNTSESIILLSGENSYQINNIRTGVTGTALTADNYYGIVITNKSLAATKVGIKGRNSGNFYTSGFAFNSTDNGTTITELTNQDLMFAVFYNDECYHDSFNLSTDASPGNADFHYFVENETDEKIVDFIVPIEKTNNRTIISHNWKHEHNIDLLVTKGYEFELQYNDDASSAASRIELTVSCRFQPRTIHG